MKATEEDVKEWFKDNFPHCKDLVTSLMQNTFNKLDLIRFHNWMEERSINWGKSSIKQEEKIGMVYDDSADRAQEAYNNCMWDSRSADEIADVEPEVMEKPEYYAATVSGKTDELKKLLQQRREYIASNQKMVDAIEFVLAERANKIEVGYRYRLDKPLIVWEIIAIDGDYVWTRADSGLNEIKYRQQLECCTKLPKDGE